MTVSITHLTTLVTVVQYGSMTAAAAALCYSLSTVSGHVARLERDLGVRLFDRSAGSVRTTEDGLRVTATARHILDLHAQLKSQRRTREIAGGRRGPADAQQTRCTCGA